MQTFRIIELFVAAGLVAGSLRAQTMGPEAAANHSASPQPNVEDLVRQALMRSPSLAAAYARQAAAREQAAPAGALPDPGALSLHLSWSSSFIRRYKSSGNGARSSN